VSGKPIPQLGPVKGLNRIRKSKKIVIYMDHKSPYKIVILANGEFYSTLDDELVFEDPGMPAPRGGRANNEAFKPL
jgi:hypothetical protein